MMITFFHYFRVTFSFLFHNSTGKVVNQNCKKQHKQRSSLIKSNKNTKGEESS